MSLMTSNCEIVENTACGKAFQYCRTHKVEPKDCPSAKKEVEFQTPFMTLEPHPEHSGIGYLVGKTPCRYDGLGGLCVEHLGCGSKAMTKREFKVGDKVRVIGQESMAAQKFYGTIQTIRSVHGAWNSAGVRYVKLECEGQYDHGVHFHELEHV